MTDIEKKALALVNECGGAHTYIKRDWNPLYEALCRAIEQHEAFRQEVSDAVEAVLQRYYVLNIEDMLSHFIIAKPDPLVEAVKDCQFASLDAIEDYVAKKLREALAKRGGKIVWREGH